VRYAGKGKVQGYDVSQAQAGRLPCAIHAIFGDTPIGWEFFENEEKFPGRKASVRILFDEGNVIDTGMMDEGKGT